jgi:hypothetical protein
MNKGIYNYQESAKEQAPKLFMAGSGITIVVGFFALLILLQKDMNFSWYLWLIFFVILAFPGVLMCITAIMQHIKGGDWNIQVTEDRLIWSAPAYLCESFNYKFSEVDFIEKQIKKKQRFRFLLIDKNAKKILLKKQSNVDIEAFVAAAEESGVQIKKKDIR